MKSLYLPTRFFTLFSGIFVVFVLSFALEKWLPFLFPLAQTLLLLAVVAVLTDMVLLFGSSMSILVHRKLPRLFTLGDINTVRLIVENKSGQRLSLSIIDELPVQLQKRDFELLLISGAGESADLSYEIRPTERGIYQFGAINVFASSFLGLIQRRFRLEEGAEVPVYPSILQMKQFELRAFHQTSRDSGIKKMRRIGHSYEFEQIKNYVSGDDYRSVNWKASSRRTELMVNQYEDERSQQVYCIIDKSRVMKMPFNGLSLLDYAINTGLVISNIVLQKGDKAGLITFSDKLGSLIKSERSPRQLDLILNALYKETSRHLEADYELLYHASRKLIKGRSVLLLFTNFESYTALERILPILRRLNRLHLLVVIFFENTEVSEMSRMECHTMEDIYQQTIARKYVQEKWQMVQKLRQYGIQAILSRPEDLSVNTINKYLELKARGMA